MGLREGRQQQGQPVRRPCDLDTGGEEARAAALRETLRREKQERDAAGRLSTRDKEARKRSEGAQQKRSFVEDEKRRAREAGGFD